MVVALVAAGEGDLGAGWQHHLGFRPAFRRQEIAAVDHRRGQGATVHHRSCARPPGGAGMGVVKLGGLVAHQLEGVAPFDQGGALGQQPFQLDRADFRAVLLFLAAMPMNRARLSDARTAPSVSRRRMTYGSLLQAVFSRSNTRSCRAWSPETEKAIT